MVFINSEVSDLPTAHEAFAKNGKQRLLLEEAKDSRCEFSELADTVWVADELD